MGPDVLFARVGLAQVLAGATPFKANNISDTYRGLVRTPDGIDTPAIIKDVPPRELANEVLAAAIGQFLGLPIPRSYIGRASQDRLPAQHGPTLADGARLVFVSSDVAQPQIATLCQGQAPAVVLAKLVQWSDLGRTYGFDSLIANIDRHAGNLLFNGDREVWLIDHGHAFTGPSWSPPDLQPADKSVGSQLRQWLTPFLDQTLRVKLAGEAATLTQPLSDVNFEQMAMANYIEQLLSEQDRKALTQFLQDRVGHVPRLAAETVGVLV